ncbi:MAG TPA: tol-pal system protein YbgF [Rhodobacteraceae bacterium]|nr:tol-pal system protein YbgF [Paracoccaceae bacterium]
MSRILALVIGLSVMALAPVAATADEQTLADIRQEMSVLHVEIQRIKRELSTTGGPGTGITGNTPLERIDAIEAALQRLTSKTEQLENRINRVVRDGTNRIGDLEFRLVELEGGDVAALGETSTLGGNTGNAAAVAVTPPASTVDTADTAELAVGEKADFKRAQEALASGDFRSAAEQLAAFTQTYPGGPLSADAHFMRGEAFEGLKDPTNAARAFLKSFSGNPNGPRAPQALYKLGTSLGDLGQTNEACVTLSEVEARFPASPAVLLAKSSMRNLGCS